MGRLRVGTSGWTYRHWQGPFYPPGLPARRWLEFYAREFDTVELNSPFYRIPPRSTFESWRRRTPEGFLFAVKASRQITHVRRLREPQRELEWFLSSARGLGEKLGPVLFQLPPGMRADPELLAQFLRTLPPGRYVLEFRHASWFCEEVYALLRDHNVALCISDSPRWPCPRVITADFLYVRLHGHERLYASRYGPEELRAWAELVREHLPRGDAFVYFDNDYAAHAVFNARELRQLLDPRGAAGAEGRWRT